MWQMLRQYEYIHKKDLNSKYQKLFRKSNSKTVI